MSITAPPAPLEQPPSAARRGLTQVAAIAWLTVREAIRSRLLLSLAAVLVVGLISLPLLISGDNTLSGRLQVILNYTLSFSVSVLSVVTLWASCAGFPSEIQDRRLYLVLTKPVHRYQLWFGKWLGIIGINAVLLTLTGIMVGMMAWHAVRTSSETAGARRQACEQFLLTRQSLAPLTPDWNAEIRKQATLLIKSGRAPAGMDAQGVEEELRQELQSARFTIAPGGAIRFAFRLPEGDLGNHDLVLKYKFDSSRPERTPVPAEWRIGSNPGDSSLLSVTNYPGLPNSLLIPGSWVRGTNTLTLTYRRLDRNNPATLMMAQNQNAPELLFPVGGIAMNLARGLLIILCRLAFLAALGLTAGCLLSMPVAVFVACFIIVLLSSAGYVESVATSGVFYVPHEGPAPTHTWLDQVILGIFKAVNVVTQPLLRLDPIPLLQNGQLVSWTMTARAASWLAGLYTAISAFVGITLFNRRELG